MVFRIKGAHKVERELFPHSTKDTERSLHHDQAKMAMRACASMKQLDQVGRIEEDTARAAGSAMNGSECRWQCQARMKAQGRAGAP